jgi:hypothetical protein
MTSIILQSCRRRNWWQTSSSTNIGAFQVGMEAASAPVQDQFVISFDDVNPCSGLIHTIAFFGTRWVHEHDGRFVVRVKRTILTNSGFVGRGRDAYVLNKNVEKVSPNDMLANGSGDRIRAHIVIVLDLRTSQVKAFSRAFTCVDDSDR